MVLNERVIIFQIHLKIHKTSRGHNHWKQNIKDFKFLLITFISNPTLKRKHPLLDYVRYNCDPKVKECKRMSTITEIVL